MEPKNDEVVNNALKFIRLEDDEFRVGNYMVLFGGRDLSGFKFDGKQFRPFKSNPDGSSGEYFTEKTDFESPYTKTGRLYVDFEHGLGKAIFGDDAPGRDDILGYVDWSTAKRDQKGLWVERALFLRDKYVDALKKFVEAGLLGSSVEAVPGKVKIKNNGEIERWALKRDSISVIPADPRMLGENGLAVLKSLVEQYPALKDLYPRLQAEPQEGGEPSADANSATPVQKNTQPITHTEVNTMASKFTENVPATTEPAVPIAAPAENGAVKALQGQVDELSTNMNKILAVLEKSHAAENAGYVTNMGGDNDPTHKSFGDFLLAVKRKDTKRLVTVYGARKDLSEGTGTAGGVLVPDEFATGLLEVASEASPIMQRVNIVPVSGPSGTYPALDQFVTPTAGAGGTALTAGLTAATTPEKTALTEDEPAFTQLQWRLNKVGGFTQASLELVEDSPQAIEALLSRLFVIAINNKNERNVIRGTGAGEPEGILNAACAIGITPNTNNAFGEADALAMLSRFKPLGGQPVWIMHRGVIPDFANFTASGSDLVNWNAALRGELLGYPIIYSEHSPQDDNAGDVILADLSAYLFFRRSSGVSIGYSEEFAFTSELGTWRFSERNDGKPWLKSAITLADPQGSYTVSPFVYHND
jgi:HK97 family phage major capsid protein